jgi:hypothetical protein
MQHFQNIGPVRGLAVSPTLGPSIERSFGIHKVHTALTYTGSKLEEKSVGSKRVQLRRPFTFCCKISSAGIYKPSRRVRLKRMVIWQVVPDGLPHFPHGGLFRRSLPNAETEPLAGNKG